ncbi:hypothetical protein ACIRQF_20225 [Streptomyces sp. NPDC101191]|uniref:hypothetical protein n=1 Tax=Streptomyces sp. NPDC101191 TaxID=3366126 RepID=UPI003824260F
MPYVPPVPPMPPQAAPGAPAGGRPGARNAVIAGVVVAVLAAGSVGGWFLWGRGGTDDGKGRGTTAAPGVSATSGSATDADGAPTGTPSDSPSPSDGVPPAGFRLVEESGFTLAVPEGWNRTASGSSVFYNAPDGLGLVQVYRLDEPEITPYEALRQTSRDLAAKNPGYREISLARTGPGDESVELVYSYDRTEGRRKVVDRAFVAGDGKQYAVLAAGPESAWPEQRKTLDTALEFFEP